MRLLMVLALVNVLSAQNPQQSCNELLIGQYTCEKPEIDLETQEIRGCQSSGVAFVECKPLSGIRCGGREFNGSEVGFVREVECRYTNGYCYITALALSLFLGWLGIDRFYLGYPALGLLKLATFGVCGFGALFDFLLIALQCVLPSDGSNYVVAFYGPRLFQLSTNNETYYKPQPD